MSSGVHKNQSTTYAEGTKCQARRAPRVGLKGGRHRRYSLAERLAARTEKGPSCWLLTGYVHPNGYVLFHSRVNGKPHSQYAHRIAYELAHGPIPEGLVVMHSCDEPRCVNPDHLTVGTQADNVRDSVRKGRHGAHLATGIRLNGHPSRRLGAFDRRFSQHQLNTAFERVPFVHLPIRGVLHVGQRPTPALSASMANRWREALR